MSENIQSRQLSAPDCPNRASIVDIPFFSQLISCGEVVVRTDDPCLWHWCVNALNRFGYSGLPGNADRKNLPVLTVTSPHEMSWKKMECLLYWLLSRTWPDFWKNDREGFWIKRKRCASVFTCWHRFNFLFICFCSFEYSQTFVDNRQLENLSWDVWTLSPIDYTSMVNVSPIPRLIKAAEANK